MLRTNEFGPATSHWLRKGSAESWRTGRGSLVTEPAAGASGEEAGDEWWQACYLAGGCDDILQAAERSVAVFAPKGGGKSTAIAAAARELAATALVARLDASARVRAATA